MHTTKLLIDTNIFIYSLDNSSIFNKRVVSLMNNMQYELYTTTKNISEFIAVSTKQGIDNHAIISFLDEIEQNTIILYPNPVSLSIFKRLFLKYSPKGNRVYDFEIISIALAYKISHLATINIDDFKGVKEIKLIDL